MRILLICPSMYDGDGKLTKVKKGTLVPQSIFYLAALTPEPHTVTCVDEPVEDIDFDAQVDLVGITTTTITARKLTRSPPSFDRGASKLCWAASMHPWSRMKR